MSQAPQKYELDKEQMASLEKAFLSMTTREGWAGKFEKINEKLSQVARSMFGLTPKCTEQEKALDCLRMAQYWFEQAIKKHEF